MSAEKKFMYGIFNDDDVVLSAVTTLRRQGLKVKDVVSPFPIHGMDHALGLKRTRISICCFLFGMTGCGLAMLMIWYMNISDWPMNIGGKPNETYLDNVLAFVPISFEFTVLCAAHGMAITYLLRNKTLPGMPAQNPDPRTTDDKFVMELRLSENSQFTEAELHTMLNETGMIELDQKEILN